MRWNVLTLAFLILLTGLAALGAGIGLHLLDADESIIIAVPMGMLTAVVGPMGMMAKELLTDPPPPVVPASTVTEIIAVKNCG